MNIYRNFDEINYDKKTVLTVGTFDGVHIGHQFILNKLIEVGKRGNLRNVLLTIHPHPQIVLNKAGRPAVSLLTSLDERLDLFEKYGVENVLIVPFTYEFSQIPARTFVIDYLLKKVGLTKILIGYDHLFGKDRIGDENLLIELSTQYDFKIEKLERIGEADHSISSTAIRNALQISDVETANKLMGHHYGLRGEVVYGMQRGRTIGFPTANILPDDEHKLLPPLGVYFVYTFIDGVRYFGMANLGYRPTVSNEHKLSIEAHFFDFNKDIYHKNITIYFVKKIREEIKFSSLEALTEQISKDRETCLNLKNELF